MKKVLIIILLVLALLGCIVGFAANHQINGFETDILEGVNDIPDGYTPDILDGVNDIDEYDVIEIIDEDNGTTTYDYYELPKCD